MCARVWISLKFTEIRGVHKYIRQPVQRKIKKNNTTNPQESKMQNGIENGVSVCVCSIPALWACTIILINCFRSQQQISNKC